MNDTDKDRIEGDGKNIKGSGVRSWPNPEVRQRPLFALGGEKRTLVTQPVNEYTP